MAKFVFSPLVSDARGKFGNAVFSANKSGAYIRNLVKPANPRTAAQIATRAKFGAVSQAWRELSQAQRYGWNAATIDFMQQDVFGQNVRLSGFQLFVKLNNSLAALELAQLQDAPGPVSLPQVPIQMVQANPNLLSIENVAPVPDDVYVAIYPSRSMSEGTDSGKDAQFRFTAIFSPGMAAGQVNLLPEYAKVFGAPVPGSKIFFKVQVVHAITGQRSKPQFYYTTVTQGPVQP